jgi:hypothetical protein
LVTPWLGVTVLGTIKHFFHAQSILENGCSNSPVYASPAFCERESAQPETTTGTDCRLKTLGEFGSQSASR